MDRETDLGEADRRWLAVFSQRPEVPAWLISMILHAVIFLVLALTLPLVPRVGAAPERIADVGVALKNEAGDSEYYQTEGDAGHYDVTTAVTEAAGSLSLDSILPTESPVDPTAALPEAMNILGTSAGGEGVPSAGGAAGGPGGNTRSFGGKGRTRVFGVPGEGYKFAYVFDRSASMGGSQRSPLAVAKEELITSLADLESTHQFMIIFYNEFQESFNPSGQRGKLPFATERNKERARRFVRGITAAGSTRHEEALMAALRTGPDVMFFLTDAAEPQLTAAQLYKIHRKAAGVTINAIEFGLGPKSGSQNFLEKLAWQNGGGYQYIDITRRMPVR